MTKTTTTIKTQSTRVQRSRHTEGICPSLRRVKILRCFALSALPGLKYMCCKPVNQWPRIQKSSSRYSVAVTLQHYLLAQHKEKRFSQSKQPPHPPQGTDWKTVITEAWSHSCFTSKALGPPSNSCPLC